jgi:hypothetical protein
MDRPDRRAARVLVLWLATLGSASAEVARSSDAATGLVTWAWHDGASRITLAQLLPDQVRAFFQGRGFSAAQSERVATGCVFQLVIRNGAAADAAMTVELPVWRVERAGGDVGSPRLAAAWEAEWVRLGVASGPRVAFRWALFPARQRFAPGDWNMGMLTFDLAHGTTFDLHAAWHAGSQVRSVRFRDLACAEDR